MGFGKRFDNLDGHVQGLPQLHWFSLDLVGQSLARYVLHDDKGAIRFLLDLVHSADVWVV